MVGGLERVYEIGHDFRNEGMDRTHNPEFTMLEFYEAYVDYHHLMALTETMLSDIVGEVTGSTDARFGEHIISFAPPYQRLSLRAAAAEAATERLRETGQSVPMPVTEADLRDRDRAGTVARLLGLDVAPADGPGKIAMAMFEALWEDRLIQPTFVYDFPTEVSPLSKQKADDPDTVERFELYTGGFEIANGFSELNDPAEQRRRFEAEMAEKARVYGERYPLDEDFLAALAQMPPASGSALGFDRLVMLMTGATRIEQVLWTPVPEIAP